MKNCYTTKAYAEIYDSLTEDEIRSGKLEHEARTICNESGTMQVNLTNDEAEEYLTLIGLGIQDDADVWIDTALGGLIRWLKSEEMLEPEAESPSVGVPIPELTSEENRRQDIIELAREQRSAGDLEPRGVEIDDDAKVSEGEDNGAYVQVWAWVSFEGTPLDKNPVQENK